MLIATRPMVTESDAPTASLGIPWPDLNEGLYYDDVISPRDSGLTLTEFYSTKHKSSAPLQGWLTRICKGQITVDGVVIKEPNTMLRAGQRLVYHRLPWKEPEAPYSIEILFDDNDIIVLNKPSGLQVLPGGLFQQRTVLKQLQRFQNQRGNGSNPVPVHRLGRGTSGILLCAKTKVAKTRLSSYFAHGTSMIGLKSVEESRSSKQKCFKIYRTIVQGIVSQEEITINQPIGVMQYPGVAKGLYVALPSGKPAQSIVKVLERNLVNNHSLIQVLIETGRPHQIRIHLSFIGHPLLGDPLYGNGGMPKHHNNDMNEALAEDGGYTRPAQAVPGDCGYFLHAHQLTFPHPVAEEIVKVTAPLPSTLQTSAEIEASNFIS